MHTFLIKQIAPMIIALILILILNESTAAIAAEASLAWDANTEADLAGYKVYFGTSSRSYGTPVDVGNQTAFTVAGLNNGQTYYFAVTAYDSSGNESGYSAEVNKTVNDTTPDTTPPVLSGMASGNLTSTGGVITWTTNEPATAQVEYGTTTAYGSSSALRSTLLTSHSRTLSNLAPSTLYHYRVISRDAAGNTAVSGDNTFTTAAAPDTTPPAISGIAVNNITPTSAAISWTTNESADTQIQYGPTTAYGSSTPLNTTLSTTHSQTLTGLTGATTYHYRVLSKDAAGNLATSGDNSFTTPAPPDTTAPILSGITTSNLLSTSVVIAWSTNEGATSQVEYGTTTAYGSSSTLNTTPVTSHTRTLSNLSPSTTYHYRVISKDAADNIAVSGDNTFTTPALPDTTPPTLSAISAGSITSSSVTISWTTNESADTQVQYGATSAYGSSTALDTTLTTTHSERLTGLTPSMTYHYRVLSKDAAGNLATSGDNTFITPAPPDNIPPNFSGITASNLTANSVVITWSTNEASTTQVEYGLTTAYGALSTLDATLVTNHTRTLSGLTPSTTYHFRVISKDAADNIATSGDNTFTTSAVPDTAAPILSAIAAGSVTATSAVISWTTNEAATAQVEYGTTTAYGSTSALDNTLLTGHTRTLSNLAPSTTYHFRVISKDAANNTATSGDNTFTTPAPPDTTAPTLSAIAAGNLTRSSAAISWTTNELSDTQIQYGTTLAYGSTTPLNSALTLSHSQNLTGLSAATLYHYRVLSKDAAGNLAISGDNTFTTPALPDTTPPTLSGITTGNRTPTSIVISWNTNEPATAQVEYGTTTSYGALSALDSTLGTGHTRTLNNLNPSTTYHFRVISKDAANNTATSEDNTFTTPATPDTIGPVLSQITASDIRADRTTIGWGTDEPATTQVEYGPTTAYGQLTTLNATLANSHSETLSGLQAETVYHYRVRSVDAAGNLSLSEDQTFTTSALGDITPPADVENFTAVPGVQNVTLSWTNPSDPDFAGVRILYRTDRFPTDLNDGTLLGDFSGQPNQPVSVIHAGLESNVTYYYSASSYDRSGNFQNTARASAVPFGIAESRSTSQGDGGSASGGGCAMIAPTNGHPLGPLDAAEWLGLMGLVLAGLLRKGYQGK
jgi:phosphodiesterase/alkaline phosphatase D-like protein